MTRINHYQPPHRLHHHHHGPSQSKTGNATDSQPDANSAINAEPPPVMFQGHALTKAQADELAATGQVAGLDSTTGGAPPAPVVTPDGLTLTREQADLLKQHLGF